MLKKVMLLIFCVAVDAMCLFYLYQGIVDKLVPVVVVSAISATVSIAVTIVCIYTDSEIKSAKSVQFCWIPISRASPARFINLKRKRAGNCLCEQLPAKIISLI